MGMNVMPDQAPRIVALPGGRTGVKVPADDAGEWTVHVEPAERSIAHLRATGQLSERQCDAAAEMARLYGRGDGSMPGRRPGSGSDVDEEATAEARREFRALLSVAPQRAHWAIIVLCMGEWPAGPDPRPLWREGLSAIADRMKLAP
jgi:hypothetical protein